MLPLWFEAPSSRSDSHYPFSSNDAVGQRDVVDKAWIGDPGTVLTATNGGFLFAEPIFNSDIIDSHGEPFGFRLFCGILAGGKA